MSIATELTTLDSTKQAIKQAIINKGQDLTGVNFAGYAAKIDAISGGGTCPTLGVWSEAYWQSELTKAQGNLNVWSEAYWQSELTKAQGNLNGYIRDPEWLSISTLLESDKKFIGLYAIRQGENFLALRAAGSYTVDWGDGIVENFNGYDVAYHSYDYDLVDLTNTTLTSKGYKQVIVQVYPQAGQLFTLIDINLKHNKANMQKYSTGFLDISIAGTELSTVVISGSTQNVYHGMLESFSLNTNNVTDMSNMFNSCYALTVIPLMYTGNVTDMSAMFNMCLSLTTIPLLDTINVTGMRAMFNMCVSLTTIPLLDTSNVTDMSSMFNTCYALTSIPLLNTSSLVRVNAMFNSCYRLTYIPLLNTSNVTAMVQMFYMCLSLRNVPLLDTSNVTDMNNMFYSCRSLTTIPPFDTSSVTNMSNTFSICYSLVTIPLLDTNSVTNMSNMFNSCSILTTIPLLDTGNVTNMSRMFSSCYNLRNTPFLNTSNTLSMNFMFSNCYMLTSIPLLNTSNVTNMNNMVNGCNYLTTIPLLDTSNVTDMNNMFGYCTSLTSIPLLNTSNVTNMSNMFNGCYNFIDIPLLDTHNVINMSYMFSYCTSLTSIPLLNTSKVTDMNNMFTNCYNLTYIPLLDTRNVTSMGNMFNSCYSSTTIPLLNTSNVTDMNSMFYNCRSLTTIPQFDTSKVTKMNGMFSYCYALTSIPLLNTSNVTTTGSMFSGCYSLVTIPLLDTGNVTNMSSMFANCTTLTSMPLLNTSKVTSIDSIFNSCLNVAVASVYNINIAYPVNSLLLSTKKINEVINNLPMGTSSLALTITGNHGITSGISRSGTLTNGSNVVLTTDTSSYSIGDAIIGTGMNYLTPKNMKLNNSNKIFTSVAHGLQNDTPIFSLFDVNFIPTAKTLPISSNWANAAYGNGLHVCITETTGNLATVSADNGNTFTNYNIPAGTYYNLVFGGGTFVAFRYDSDKAIKSTDGQTWTEVTLPSSTTWKQACYFNGKFVCIDTNGKSVSASSSDLTTWAEGTLPGAYEFRMACSTTEITVVRYNSAGTNVLTAYSTDGITWTTNTILPTFNTYGIYSITYGNGKYLAVTNNIYTYESVDGINWSNGINVVSGNDSISYFNGTFITVKSTGSATTVYTRSDNSSVWEARALPSGTWGVPSANGSTFVFYSKNTSVANKAIVDPTFDKAHYQKFYLKNVTTDTFELSLTPGGTSIETQGIYTTGDFVYKAGSYITAIDPNVSITLSAPAIASGIQTLTVRPGLDIMQAAAKNWTITY